jgi:hypothetical protein
VGDRHLKFYETRDNLRAPTGASRPIAGDVDPEVEAAERDHVLHTVGNLTLVTGSLNSSISNGPRATKHVALLENSTLTLNRSLPRNWTVDAIRARSRWLASVAEASWEWRRL